MAHEAKPMPPLGFQQKVSLCLNADRAFSGRLRYPLWVIADAATSLHKRLSGKRRRKLCSEDQGCGTPSRLVINSRRNDLCVSPLGSHSREHSGVGTPIKPSRCCICYTALDGLAEHIFALFWVMGNFNSEARTRRASFGKTAVKWKRTRLKLPLKHLLDVVGLEAVTSTRECKAAAAGTRLGQEQLTEGE